MPSILLCIHFLCRIVWGNPVSQLFNMRNFTRCSMQKIKQVSQVLLAMQRYSWEQGVAAQAFLELGEIDLAIMLARDAVQRQGSDGRLALMLDNEGVTDPAANGEAVFFAAHLTKEPALQIAIDKMLHYLLKIAPRTSDGILLHVINAKEVWVDSMYMAPPFLAVAGQVDDAIQQIHGIKRRLWNSPVKLYAHVWDEERRAITHPEHWGVGNGWVAAGITRVIRVLPESHTRERKALENHVRELIDGCLAHQRTDGLFHNVVDQPQTFVETNLAQMLAYSIYRGIIGSWLPLQYKSHADKMREAVHQKVDDSGYVQGVCGAPIFDHAGTAPEGQAFFLLMEAAWKETQ